MKNFSINILPFIFGVLFLSAGIEQDNIPTDYSGSKWKQEVSLFADIPLTKIASDFSDDVLPMRLGKANNFEKSGIQKAKFKIPLAGNAFITKQTNVSWEKINSSGLADWTNSDAMTSVYVRASQNATISLSLSAKVLPAGNRSEAKVTLNGTSRKVHLSGADYNEQHVGEFLLKEGYNKIDISGISKTGQYFGDVSDLIISSDDASFGLLYCNKEEYYRWARRGPSCHFKYDLPVKENISYAYNEIYVPVGSDQIGSYFMAIGFEGGYFGMQVNSETERRFLFSVWSPYETDDPKKIPDDYKVILNKKGQDVQVKEFGNEGAGGQSFWVHNWKAGNTYCFLLKAEPDGRGNTDFTAWTRESKSSDWNLIASFKRPYTSIFVTRFSSFLESVDPNRGFLQREATYKNQWVRTTSRTWHRIQSAKFTVDATYRNNQRVDAIGGVNNEGYFLKNGGFFNEGIEPGTVLKFNNSKKPPVIDFSKLP